MTLNELQKWMLENDVADKWWVAIDGEVLDNLMALPDVGKIKDQHPVALVAVLHESKANDDEPEWIPFQKTEGARFKVVSSRFDGLQVNVPGAVKEAAAEKQKQEVAKAEEEKRAYEAAAAEKEKAAKPEAKSSTAVLPTAILEEMASMHDEINSLRAEMEELRDLADQLKRPILEAQKILDERESFLEMSEASLFDKAQKQEVLQTELEQLRDELHQRDEDLKQREAAV